MDGEQMLKERGRWYSDIYHIYARTSLKRQLDASTAMADVTDTALERADTSYTEAARR